MPLTEIDDHYSVDTSGEWLLDRRNFYWFYRPTQTYYRLNEARTNLIRVDQSTGRFVPTSAPGDIFPLPGQAPPEEAEEAKRPEFISWDPEPSVKIQSSKRQNEPVPQPSNDPKELESQVVIVNKTVTCVCFVCHRIFTSPQALRVHEETSELHKNNLEK